MRVLVSGNRAAAAAPAAFAELDTATGREGGSDAGAAGVTVNEPAPASEPSSLTVEPEAAAASAAEQVVQLQAEAQAAGATPSDAAMADAPVADATTADSQAVAAPPQRAPRPQQPQPPPQQRKQWQRRPPLSTGGRGGRGRGAGGRAYSGGRGGGRESAAQPEEPVGVPIPPEELWFDRGDVVPCRVTWANSRGARVATIRDPRITGCAAALCFCTLPLALPAAAALPRRLQVCFLGAATGAWLPHATPLTQALSNCADCGGSSEVKHSISTLLLAGTCQARRGRFTCGPKMSCQMSRRLTRRLATGGCRCCRLASCASSRWALIHGIL